MIRRTSKKSAKRRLKKLILTGIEPARPMNLRKKSKKPGYSPPQENRLMIKMAENLKLQEI